MRYLFLGEKPSLTRAVQKCYENHRQEVVSKVGEIGFLPLSGHVCGYYEPNDYPEWNVKWDMVDYPIIPKSWGIKETNHKIVSQIKKELEGYDGLICGCDSDQEGYGIFYLVANYLHVTDMPTLRFIEHSLTDAEILQSLITMTDYYKDPVHQRYIMSFLMRSRADWLYGMNVTRLMTVQTGSLMTVGRVKAPTIKLVYDNSMAIENFKPETYYQIEADYGTFKSLLSNESGAAMKRKEDLKDNIPLDGKVEKVDYKKESTHAPKLYDLAAIQTEAGKKYGYSLNETLAIVQSLYEEHKLLSYPRTQCRYISSEKAKEFPQMLELMEVFPDLAGLSSKVTFQDIQRVYADKAVVNNKEVEKESHDALLPTDRRPDLSKLNEDEKRILKMVYTRLLAQFLPNLETAKTKVWIRHGNYLFTANGKMVLSQGWRELYGELEDVSLPALKENDQLHANKFNHLKKQTTPPKRLTQASLGDAMCNIANLIKDPELKKSLADSKGIGTPATRGEIVQDIIRRGYVENRKGLYITQAGKEYVENLDGINIISPVFAAEQDTMIKRIQRGEQDYKEAYKSLLQDLYGTCEQIKRMDHSSATVVECANCGQMLVRKGNCYQCQKCGLKIPRNICGVEITEEMLGSPEELKKTRKFKKKNGDVFYSALKYTENGLEFSSGLECPFCGSDMKKNRGGAFCDCGLSVFRNICGKTLTDAELEELVTTRRLSERHGFVSKAGKQFSAALFINDDGEVKLEFS